MSGKLQVRATFDGVDQILGAAVGRLGQDRSHAGVDELHQRPDEVLVAVLHVVVLTPAQLLRLPKSICTVSVHVEVHADLSLVVRIQVLLALQLRVAVRVTALLAPVTPTLQLEDKSIKVKNQVLKCEVSNKSHPGLETRSFLIQIMCFPFV